MGSVLSSKLPGLPASQVNAAANAVAAGAVHQVVSHIPPAHRAAAVHVVHSAFVSGLDQLFWVSVVIAGVGALGCALLIRQRDLVSGRS